MLLERLAVNNVKNIIVFGTCGSICKDAKIGDVIVPTSAISEEGTSKLYSSMPKYQPSSHLLKHIQGYLKKEKIPFSEGKIWTTDAPYMETTKKVAYHRDKGAIGVDMELSALFAVCNLKKINIAGVLIVSDELHSAVWKTGFKSRILKNMYKKVFNTILTAFDGMDKDMDGIPS